MGIIIIVHMDIIKAFTLGAVTTDIKILTCNEQPLFMAKDVGTVLGFKNIRPSLKDFKDSEKVVKPIYSAGGSQQATFLTERGLYKLMMRSNKKLAEPFQDWVFNVISEIRETGRYELQRQSEIEKALMKLKADKDHTIALCKAYDHQGCVYIARVATLSDGRSVYKIGETDDIKTRVRAHQTQYGQATLIEVYPCTKFHAFEQWVFDRDEMKGINHKEPVNGHDPGRELFCPNDDYTLDEIKKLMSDNVDDHRGYAPAQYLESTRNNITKELMNRVDSASSDECKIALLGVAKAYLEGKAVAANHGEEPYTQSENSEALHASSSLSQFDSRILHEIGITHAPPIVPVTHRSSDMCVQQYDPVDMSRLVAVHDGVIEAARSIDDAQRWDINDACRNNTIYRGFRWFRVTQDLKSEVQTIPPTQVCRTRRRGLVAQISPETGRVVALHPDQRRVALCVGLRDDSSICIALNKGSSARNFRWRMWDDCDEALRATYEGDPSAVWMITSGKEVAQLHAVTGDVIETHKNMTVVCKKYQASHKLLGLAHDNGTVYKGFRWRIPGRQRSG